MNRATLTCILTLASTVYGCDGSGDPSDAGPSPDDASVVDARTPAPDASVPDASVPDAGPPASSLTVQRWGERLYGQALAMSRIDRELWIGTSAVFDSSLGEEGPLRSALVRLDLDRGVLRVFEDELPRFEVEPGVEGPTPTAGVVADGARRLVASRAGILVVEADALRLQPVVVGGASLSTTHLAIDRAGGRARLFASTEVGLLELDPDTFERRRTLAVAELGGNPGSLAIDPESGAVFVAVHASGPTDLVVRVHDDSPSPARLVAGEGGAPAGRVGDLVFSPTHGGVFVAFASWDPRDGGVALWDGTAIRRVVDEDALSRAARGESVAFGAHALAYDDDAQVLVVGGLIRSTGALGILEGGGLAWVDVSDPSRAGVAGVSTTTSGIRGDMVTAAAYDPVTRRTYVGLRQPCDERRLGNVGVHAVTFDRGEPRFEMPILSGVRDVARVEGELWVGLRDDNPGVACEGVDVQVGLARVDGSRSGLVPNVRGWDAGRFGVTQIDFRSLEQRVVGGFRTDLFVGGPGGGLLLNPALELGTSLWPEDVQWEDARTFWVAGRSSHSPGDPDRVADTGPRGAARVVLNDAGGIESVTHYVRLDRDLTPGVITGLPSAEVYDVVLDAEGTVYLVCGTERMMATYDRQPRDEFRLAGALRRGGVARIEDDGSITVIADATEVPDGRAAAFAPDGTLYVLDATRGLLRRTDAGFEPVALAEVPDGSEPQTLWVGEAGDLVAGFDTGALLRIGGESRFLDALGWVWSVDATGDVLLLGTDRGLVRVIPEGVVDPGEAVRLSGEAPPFVVLDPPPPPPPPVDGGTCIPAGSPCGREPSGCCPGLVCSSLGIVQTCAAP